MSKSIAAGDSVQVADREVAAADAKSGLFYPHYRGLVEVVAKTYPDGTAAITVNSENLPEEIRNRHKKGSETQRQKWLDGLSDEARNRLSAAEKQFSLRYTVLVSAADLSPAGDPVETPPSRKSDADYAEAEARHLEEIARKRKS